MFSSLLIWGIMLGLARSILADCQPPYESLGLGCYAFTQRANWNWFQAYFTCSLQFRGHLAEITSSQEQSDIEGYLNTIFDINHVATFWIGGSDILMPRSYMWMTTGTNFSGAYNNWQSNQPNLESFNCVHMDPDRKWYTSKCDRQFGSRAICEVAPI